MLLALVFRGVAFEFRFRDAEHRTFWDEAFDYGSAVATFAQGMVLGAFIQGFKVDGRHFAGGSLDCFTPFSLLHRAGTSVRLRASRRVLADLQDRGRIAGARPWSRPHLLSRRACSVAIVSLWTPLMSPDIAHRWFSWPNIAFLAPVPIITALLGLLEWRAIGRGRTNALLLCGGAFRNVLSRHRHQPVAHDRAAPFHAVAGGVRSQHADCSCCLAPCSCCRSFWFIRAGPIGCFAARCALISVIIET